MVTKNNDIFPQANSINLVLITLQKIKENKYIKKDEMAIALEVSSRQVDYYINVLYYFSLITNKNELTLKGQYINDPVLNHHEKLIILKNIMIEKNIFKEIDSYITNNKKIPSRNFIATLIEKYYKYAPSTYFRRADTVRSWFVYFINNNVYGGIKL